MGLNAKSELAGALSDNKVIDYNANAMSSRLARSFIKKTGFEIAVHRKGKLRHDQVLDLFASAKIYEGPALSDGISTSLPEAMAMGAIPVQMSTACRDEWFTNLLSKSTKLQLWLSRRES